MSEVKFVEIGPHTVSLLWDGDRLTIQMVESIGDFAFSRNTLALNGDGKEVLVVEFDGEGWKRV